MIQERRLAGPLGPVDQGVELPRGAGPRGSTERRRGRRARYPHASGKWTCNVRAARSSTKSARRLPGGTPPRRGREGARSIQGASRLGAGGRRRDQGRLLQLFLRPRPPNGGTKIAPTTGRSRPGQPNLQLAPSWESRCTPGRGPSLRRECQSCPQSPRSGGEERGPSQGTRGCSGVVGVEPVGGSKPEHARRAHVRLRSIRTRAGISASNSAAGSEPGCASRASRPGCPGGSVRTASAFGSRRSTGISPPRRAPVELDPLVVPVSG